VISFVSFPGSACFILKKDTIIAICLNNKKITISFNVKINPNGLTQDVNNIFFPVRLLLSIVLTN
jgi:hypothetical protein